MVRSEEIGAPRAEIYPRTPRKGSRYRAGATRGDDSLVVDDEEDLVTDTETSLPSGDAVSWTPPSVAVHYYPPRFPDFVALVELHGEHDLDTHESIEGALRPIYGDVLIDLSACSFIDSTVVGVIVARTQELRREDHRLELIVPTENCHVVRVIDLVGLRTFLTVHEQAPETRVGEAVE
jgi:anti-anti-sigma factor